MGLVHKNCRLAYGCTRTVLLIGNFAFKFPSVFEWRLFLLGLLANMQERLFWTMCSDKLCPVVWSIPCGLLVVMRRAKELTEDEWAEFDVESWLKDGDYPVPAEPKIDSFGWLDGRIVAVDYGN